MGFAEDQGQDVAGATLQAGVRRIPAAETASALSAGDPSVVIPLATVAAGAASPAAEAPLSAGDPSVTVPLLQPVVPVAVAAGAASRNFESADLLVTSGHALGDANQGEVTAPPTADAGRSLAGPAPLSASAGDPSVTATVVQPIILAAAAPATAIPVAALNGLGVGVTPAPLAMPSGEESGLGAKGAAPAAFVPARTDPVGSFVSLVPSADPAEGPSSDQTPVVERHSPRTPAENGVKPTIKWDQHLDEAGPVSTALAGDSPEWLEDFLNHLGQSQAQRNPNAGMRIRPAAASTAPHG